MHVALAELHDFAGAWPNVSTEPNVVRGAVWVNQHPYASATEACVYKPAGLPPVVHALHPTLVHLIRNKLQRLGRRGARPGDVRYGGLAEGCESCGEYCSVLWRRCCTAVTLHHVVTVCSCVLPWGQSCTSLCRCTAQERRLHAADKETGVFQEMPPWSDGMALQTAFGQLRGSWAVGQLGSYFTYIRFINPQQHGVVHNPHALQELHIPSDLGHQPFLARGSHVDVPAATMACHKAPRGACSEGRTQWQRCGSVALMRPLLLPIP